jgi:poly(A) polymerase
LGKPGQDIDLLTVGADGVPVLKAVAERFHWNKPLVFDRFQTGQVRGDGFVIEVVQARSEAYDPTSRKPDVKPGTLDEDIWRRDFTVNALCETMDGKLLDITGQGVLHLRAKILRTPLDPKQTFSEGQRCPRGD